MLRLWIALLPSLLLAPLSESRAGTPTPTATRVIAGGPLAGTQIFVSPDGLVRPDENQDSGAAGRVRTNDGGRTWSYQDAAGGAEGVVELDALPTHLQRLSGVVSRLHALARRDRVLTAGDLVTPAMRELQEARDAWLAQGGASLWKPEVRGALRELDGVMGTLNHAAAGTDAEVASAYQDVLPRLHAITAVALAQPRDGSTVTVQQTVIDFGVVPVGSSRPASIGLSTTADGEVIVAADVSGLAAPFSSAGGNVSVFKASGGSLQVTFAPTQAGDFQGTVVLSNPGLPGGKVTVQVKGSARTETLVVLPNPVDFGKVVIGSSKSITVSVINNSTQPANIETFLTLGLSRKTGQFLPLKPPFSRGPVNEVNGTFQPGEKGEVVVTFTPKHVGKISAQLYSRTSVTNGVTVPIVGEGVAALETDHALLLFGDVNLGQSATQPLTVKNNTDQPATITLKTTGAGFSVVGPASVTIPANGSTTVNVTFTPSADKPDHSSVEITGPNGFKEKVELTGTGKKVPLTGLSLSKDNVAFGMVPKNTLGTQSFTITNTSSAAKTVTLNTSGLNSTFFHVQGNTSFTLNPGAVQTVTLTFLATGVCTHKDKIVVESDGGSAEVAVTASAK